MKPEISGRATRPAGTRWRLLAALAIPVAGLATLAAHGLHALIGLFTQLAFYGRFSFEHVSPAGHGRGAWVILLPALGGGLIALLARFGTRAILGHGIPEVMQQVLANRSRIAPRVALLKPLASAVSIGTGGPYGAEGPVIATGGALGSLLGQALTMSATERKILLAAGATAAMTALFGSPVAATLLSLELLLFEFRSRSLVPVAVAAMLAQAWRFAWGEPPLLFPLTPPETWSAPVSETVVFVVIGALAGALAVGANDAVHRLEAGFARLPVHWMWRPVIGGLLVGMIGWFEPGIFGAGYEVIGRLLAGDPALGAVALVCGLKLLAWVISLGSGTTGGTLAPMLVVGGGVGTLAAAACGWLPGPGVAPGLAALAGMIAFFAGGSRAFFASIVLGVEITQQAGVLWPVATAATAAVTVAQLLSRRSFMTSPVEQKGVRVPTELDVDVFEQVEVAAVMERNPCTIPARMTVAELADRVGRNDPELCHHSALLVTEETGALAGVITRRDLVTAIERGRAAETIAEVMVREPVVAYPDEPLHEAIERMHDHGVGRLPVVDRAAPSRLVGYLGRRAVLSARRLHLQEQHSPEQGWITRRRSAS